MISETILHYKIIKKLGEGGMGVVYLAEDTKLKRYVAIKFLPHQISANEEERKRFEIEAQAAASFNHPNISTIYAIEETDSEVFIVMEFIDGIELRDKLKSGPIPSEKTLNIAIQIAMGLEAAHKKGIIHRDIKSQNIMITEAGKVKVMDFGLAKIQGETGLTKSGSTLGTVSYMSPEQATNEPVDHRSDIWSLGVLLYEMITGELPFKGKHEAGILYSIVNSELLKIPNVDCPEGLGFIVQKALVKNPDERYQNMSEVLNDLKTIESGNVLPKPHIKKTSYKAMIFAVALIAVCIIALVILFLNNKPDNNLPPMRTVRITTYPGEEYNPVFSPDGQSIAFSWNDPQKNNFDIYVKRIDSGNPLRLTSRTWDNVLPTWSPDGNHIAFVRRGEYGVTEYDDEVYSSGWSEIYMVPSLGGREQKIINFTPQSLGPMSPISWSRDSKFIYYSSWDSTDYSFRIFKVSILTSKIEKITHLPDTLTSDYSPSISPDGRFVAFKRILKGKYDIYIQNLEDQQIKRITNINGDEIHGFCWNSDSRSILFSANLDGTFSLWKTDLERSEPIKIINGISINDPRISSGGKNLIYTEILENSNIWKIDLNNPDRETLLIGSSAFFNQMPDISPDGKRILFQSSRTGNPSIWVCDSDGSNPTHIAGYGEPFWSPDGSEILINNNDGINILKANGSLPVKITDQFIKAIWTKDGSGFYASKTKVLQIFRISRDGTVQKQITKKFGHYPQVYGDFIYYLKGYKTKEIWRVPLNGGLEEPVLQRVDGLVLRSWTVVKKGIYFIRENETSPELDFYNFNTKKITLIKEVPLASTYMLSTIAVDPKEQYLLYSKNEPVKSDIIMVENFQLN